MARYHLNPFTGNPGLCTATQQCPYSPTTEHYGSVEEARAAYEAVRASFTRPAMKKLTNESLPKAILAEAQLTKSERELLSSAIDFAATLHAQQKRKATINGRTNTPYIEHPLRNTLRLVRLGVNNYPLLVSTVLHDTVEDCAEEFCREEGLVYLNEEDARAKLAEHISKNYGGRVKVLVLSVTNPHFAVPHETPEEKNRVYREIVAKEIRDDPGTFLVKWSDIIDNAGSLHHALPHEINGSQKQAKKYLPVIPDFLQALDYHEQKFGVILTEALRHKLLKTEHRLKELLAKKA